MKRLLLILLLCVPCWAANNLTGDPNCVALYTFDEGSDPTNYLDLTSNNNDLGGGFTNRTTTVGLFKEGTTSQYTDSSVHSAGGLSDGGTSSNFPAKNGTSNSTWSVTGWYRPTAWASGGRNVVASKWNSTSAKRCWMVSIVTSGTNHYVDHFIGYNSGSSSEGNQYTGVDVQLDQWYFLAWTFDGATKDWVIRVYDQNAGTTTGTSGTKTNSMNIEDAYFYVGNVEATATFGAIGYLDEVAIFNRVLTSDEIDEICSGTFGATVTGTSNWWWRRRHN